MGQRSLGLGRAAPHQLPREKREFEGVKTPLNLEVDVMVENGCNEEITVGGHTAQPQGTQSRTECEILRKTPKWLGLVVRRVKLPENYIVFLGLINASEMRMWGAYSSNLNQNERENLSCIP